MRKQLLMLPVTLGLGILLGLLPAQAASHKEVGSTESLTGRVSAPTMHVIGASATSETVTSIVKMLDELMAASNAHQLDAVLSHYSPRFVSGDNLSLGEIKKLIAETWETFPDIQYKTQTLEVRVNGDWATVESIDTATATAKVDPVISGQAGRLSSRSRGLLYLHRVAGGWEIQSDYTLFEMATITYGNGETPDITLSTPEQAFAGDSYTAKVSMSIPRGVLAIATISQEPLVYPQIKPRDRFRSLSADKGALERIFQANTTNNNEIVTATVGLTQIGQDEEDRPTIKLNGITTIVKRVNVIPRSTFKATSGKNNLVKTSASGEIDLTTAADTPDADESAQQAENMPDEEALPPEDAQ